MPMFRTAPWLSLSLAAALVSLTALPDPSRADGDPPKPKIDCTKKANQTKPQCRQTKLLPSGPASAATAKSGSDEVYFAAYSLARSGQYHAAIDVLKLGDQTDPRILTYTGFATRKLGLVDEALTYYSRALAIDPNHVLTRAYLGEAFLQKGEPAQAREELAEIERRCSRACVEYVDLAMQIEAYDKAVQQGG